MLHVSCLKSDPSASKWVLKGIEITKNLRSPILMLVFFGKCAILNRTELDHVIYAMRDLTLMLPGVTVWTVTGGTAYFLSVKNGKVDSSRANHAID